MASVVKWGGEALVVDGAHGTIVALADGRYAMSYVGVANPLDFNVQTYGKIFNGSGTVAKTFSAHTVNSNVSHNFPTITALQSGGLVIAWEEFSSSTWDDIHFRIIDGAGQLTGTEKIANTTTSDGQITVDTTTLTNGNIVVAFTDWSNFPSEARAQIFTPTGTPVGTEFKLNGTATDAIDPLPSVTALSNGNFVALWEDDGDDGSSMAIRGQVFTSAGAATPGVEFRVNTTTNGSQASATVAAMAGGKFMVVWVDDQNPSASEAGNLVFSTIKAQLFNADGTKPVGSSELTISTSTTGDQSEPAVETLKDGRVVIVWNDASGSVVTSNYDTKITAAIYNANGTVSVEPFTVSTTSAGQQIQPSVTVLSDGRIVFSWSTKDAGNKSGVYTQMFDPRLAAIDIDGSNTLGDQLYGTAFADTFDGLGGADLLFGAGHNDTMRGGNGNDTLNGDAGNDNVNGGSNDDRLDGGAGLDTLIGEAGLDLLYGGTESDTLVGGDGNDTLNGDAGNDNVNGGNNDDRVNGGAGLDTLIGEAGLDLLYGGTENDTLLGGDGNDKLYGETGADSLSGGNHNDTLSGADGNDILNGGAGLDSLLGGNQNDTLYGGDNNDTLSGDAGNDSLMGGNHNDTLTGGDGTDVLRGEAGADSLSGGNHNDTLTGGLGVDKLSGGANDDRFVFTAATDSGVGAGLRDIITDFNLASTVEKIDLSALWTKTIVWRGTAAFTTKADVEVRYKFETSGTVKKTIVEVDIDSDVAAELQIELSGSHFALTTGDFLL